MSVALIRDGVIRPSENDSHVLTAMLPSSCPQNHAANILPLPDGALMCVWFAGTQEGIADISVWGSRLPAGGMQWSDAAKLSTMTRVQSKTRCCFSRRITCCGSYGPHKYPVIRTPPSSATVSQTTSDKPGARLPPCLINPVRSFDSQSRCLITATGCCPSFIAVPNPAKNGSAMMISAQ